MDAPTDFWGFFWAFFWMYVFIAYLIALFWIAVDIFRDHELSGWARAVWVLFLFFLPFITAVVYVIWRGSAMAHRMSPAPNLTQSTLDSAREVDTATALFNKGELTADEYNAVREKALRSAGGPQVS